MKNETLSLILTEAIDLIFCYFRSESAKMDSKPTSWPRSRMEDNLVKPSREKRKLKSSSPSSRNHPASIRRMKHFQKSSAIYTLPIREKQLNASHCITGKSINQLSNVSSSQYALDGCIKDIEFGGSHFNIP